MRLTEYDFTDSKIHEITNAQVHHIMDCQDKAEQFDELQQKYNDVVDSNKRYVTTIIELSNEIAIREDKIKQLTNQMYKTVADIQKLRERLESLG